MSTSVIKHSLLEQPFSIPMQIRKRLPIQKSIFELCEPEIKKSPQPDPPIQKQESEMVDPLVMDSALIKSLLFGRIESYLIFLSIVVSGFIVYWHSEYIFQTVDDIERGKVNQDYGYDEESMVWASSLEQPYRTFELSPEKYHLLLLQSFISILLTIITSLGIYFESQTNKTRNLSPDILQKIIKLFLFILHPTVYTESYNYLLHLVLILRLQFLVSYLIKTSTYHSNRSFRLTEIYGIKPSENFFFAIKSIVDQMQIKDVVVVYVTMVAVFSHGLFLGGLGETVVKPFWTCFEVVIVTMPTIGYGQYYVRNTLQRSIILIGVVIGACLNSLITLIMLKQFQMSTQQTFSYNLLLKLSLKQRMQHISREYIISTMQQLRSNNFSSHPNREKSRKEIDNNFKEEYKYLKTHYTEINTRDLNSMFNLFKEQLREFKVQSQQMNNMIFVLVKKLRNLSAKRREKVRFDGIGWVNGLHKQ